MPRTLTLLEAEAKRLNPNQTSLTTALTPTEMPAPGDAQVSKASLAAQRAVKKRKGRASTILTGLFGRGGLSAPVTALSEAPTGSLSLKSILDTKPGLQSALDIDYDWWSMRPVGPGSQRSKVR